LGNFTMIWNVWRIEGKMLEVRGYYNTIGFG